MIMTRPGNHHDDPRYDTAVDLLTKDPTLMVTRAMRAAGFSLEEIKDRTIQMRVRRRIPSKKDRKAGIQPNSNTSASASPSQSTSNLSALEADAVVVGASGSAAVPVVPASNEVEWWGGGDNHVAAVDHEEEFDCKLQDWISYHRSYDIGGKDDGRLVNISKQSTYLEQSVQILHSLADKLLNENMLNIDRSYLITVSNIAVRTSTSVSVLGHANIGELSAYFVTMDDDSPFCHECGMDETQNKYAAMHAFAQIAYAICLGGRGPRLPDFIRRNVTASESSMSIALSLRDDSPEGGVADEKEDEDEILDMFRKHYRVTESEEVKGSGYISAMLDVGIPLPMVRFISDLLGDEHGGMFRSDRAFASFDDVLSDLKQMMVNPDKFLHGASSDRWKIVFDDKLYGRDAATKALMIAADRVTCKRVDALVDRFARLAGMKSEVVMVSGHSGAGKSCLVRIGCACLEMGGWLFLRCKFDRVGEISR
jgi:hypothetical protein